MNYKFRKNHLFLLGGIAALGVMLFAVPVFASYGLESTASAANLKNAAGGGDIPTIIGNIIGTALSLISVIFFILMLYGGFLWMTARGDSGQTTKALDTIIAAVIGIVIILGAYALTQFVFNSLSGSSTPAAGGGAGGSGSGGATTLPERSLDTNVACCYMGVELSIDDINYDPDGTNTFFESMPLDLNATNNDCNVELSAFADATCQGEELGCEDSYNDLIIVPRTECIDANAQGRL